MIRRYALNAVFCLALAAFGAPSVAAGWFSVADDLDSASQCDSLDSVPLTFLTSQINFQSAIQGIFTDSCIMCHTDHDGGAPPAGLSLDPGVSWSNIVNHQSSQEPFLYRVVPNRPDLSLLFHKVNCSRPGVGMRMPANGPPYLSAEDQAIVSDWILAGAPSTTTDVIFLSTFGPRG